jgi:hypothetical protein
MDARVIQPTPQSAATLADPASTSSLQVQFVLTGDISLISIGFGMHSVIFNLAGRSPSW